VEATDVGSNVTGGTVYAQGWTLDDVRWEAFDASKIEPALLAAVKGASLVEHNAPDYVGYLRRVFADAGEKTLNDIEEWGREEIQHGQALGRWAELADPDFNFAESFARFRAGYKPAHFVSDDTVSIRGSRRGEMIARCVVESGTSSFYSAMRDATEEPVLKEIAGRIAADEFRHYRLFYETLVEQPEADLSFWRKMRVALSRMQESDDDELSYAYYCANVGPEEEAQIPYRRDEYTKAYNASVIPLYQRTHVRKLTQMVAKAVGANPNGRPTAVAEALLWRVMRMRVGLNAAGARAAA
jgi:hypothetical protein